MSTPIERSDIRVGDYILATTMDDGVLIERRGKVETISQFGTLGNREGGYIHNPSWSGKYTYQLIDRPKPKLPGLPGALIIAKNMKYEEPEVVLINRTGAWETLDGYSVYQTQQIGEWALASLVEVKA